MVTKLMKWVSITALLLTVFWHPSASLDFVVCAGAILVVLALFFIKQEIETYYGVDNRSKPESRRSEEHTSELQSPCNLVCRLLLEKKKKKKKQIFAI